jgi:hypothetical protein
MNIAKTYPQPDAAPLRATITEQNLQSSHPLSLKLPRLGSIEWKNSHRCLVVEFKWHLMPDGRYLVEKKWLKPGKKPWPALLYGRPPLPLRARKPANLIVGF